jgi:hypothetical protein
MLGSPRGCSNPADGFGVVCYTQQYREGNRHGSEPSMSLYLF